MFCDGNFLNFLEADERHQDQPVQAAVETKIVRITVAKPFVALETYNKAEQCPAALALWLAHMD